MEAIPIDSLLPQAKHAEPGVDGHKVKSRTGNTPICPLGGGSGAEIVRLMHLDMPVLLLPPNGVKACGIIYPNTVGGDRANTNIHKAGQLSEKGKEEPGNRRSCQKIGEPPISSTFAPFRGGAPDAKPRMKLEPSPDHSQTAPEKCLRDTWGAAPGSELITANLAS